MTTVLSTRQDLVDKLFTSNSLCLMVSICRDCVLGCNYCYAIDPKNLPPKRVLSLDLLEKIIKDAFDTRHENLTFEWTGGEALLAGQGFFEKILEFQGKYKKNDKKYHNCIQTSGAIYNEEFYDFLIENKFSLGITIDGPKDLHESQRPTKGGSSSFDSVLKSYFYIKKKQKRCGILCTLTKNSLERYKDIIEFYKSIDVSGFHTNPYVFDPQKPNRDDDLGITPKEYAAYFKNQFDYYLDLNDQTITPNTIDFLLKKLTGVSSAGKCTHGGKCLTNFLNIDDVGNAAICPKFLGYENMRLGNIKEKTMAELLSPDNPVMRRFIDQRLISVNGCEKDGCAYLAVCNSGCPYDSFLNGQDGSIEHRDHLCSGKKEIYTHLDNKLKSFELKTVTSIEAQ